MLDAHHPNQWDVLPGRVLASRGTGPGMRLGWSGMALAIDGRADVQSVAAIGSGMVLAIGDLAGATFITLLAAPATQFARAVAYGPYARSRSRCREAEGVSKILARSVPRVH